MDFRAAQVEEHVAAEVPANKPLPSHSRQPTPLPSHSHEPVPLPRHSNQPAPLPVIQQTSPSQATTLTPTPESLPLTIRLLSDSHQVMTLPPLPPTSTTPDSLPLTYPTLESLPPTTQTPESLPLTSATPDLLQSISPTPKSLPLTNPTPESLILTSPILESLQLINPTPESLPPTSPTNPAPRPITPRPHRALDPTSSSGGHRFSRAHFEFTLDLYGALVKESTEQEANVLFSPVCVAALLYPLLLSDDQVLSQQVLRYSNMTIADIREGHTTMMDNFEDPYYHGRLHARLRAVRVPFSPSSRAVQGACAGGRLLGERHGGAQRHRSTDGQVVGAVTEAVTEAVTGAVTEQQGAVEGLAVTRPVAPPVPAEPHF
ncbi:hypothetical protein C7M84_002702 [Penaeus vannamei]|uniref:Uncharacterized protein n=1 Tax=Penaeus vannamei TaxID=6689 RepID=A0A3R7MBX9_PENVA|nr:hypothetical protein C7M84_002702 [Penaeus vannamei]